MPSPNSIPPTSNPVNQENLFGDFAAGPSPFAGQKFDFDEILTKQVTFTRITEDSPPADMRSYIEHDNTFITKLTRHESIQNLFILGDDLVSRLDQGTMNVVAPIGGSNNLYTLKKLTGKNLFKDLSRSDPNQYLLKVIKNNNVQTASLTKRIRKVDDASLVSYETVQIIRPVTLHHGGSNPNEHRLKILPPLSKK